MARKDRAALDAAVESAAFDDDQPPAATPPARKVPIVREIEEAGLRTRDEILRLKAELAESYRVVEEAKGNGAFVLEIEPERIVDSRFRDRDERALTGPEIDDFALDISANGQIIPVEVRPSKEHPGKYEIIHGHRRVRACAKLNRPVRALVKDIDDLDAVRRMEIENSRRKDLSPLEKGRKYRVLVEAGLMTQAQIAQEFRYTPGHISQLVSLTDIPAEVLDALGDPRDMTQAQGVNLLRAFRVDPTLRDRAIQEAPRVKESGLPIDRRLAYFRDAKARLDGSGARAEELSGQYRDDSGRSFAVLAHQGKRPVIRFDPVEEAFVRYLWEQIPALRSEFVKRGR